ncbi:MAG TPA: hypothetical protein PKA58_04000 [Polyangium sp.]|nr:hypothetical protein [Polyangium sp.]
MKRTIAFLLASTVVGGSVLAGCGDDTNTNSTGGAGASPIPLEELSSKFSALYCEMAFSCCTTMEQGQLFDGLASIPKTEAECNTVFKAQLDTYIYKSLTDAVNAGRLKYDAALAGTCFGKVTKECTLLSGNSPLNDAECDKVFVGLVADGGDCGGENECAVAGSYCPIPQGAMMGKCTVLPKEGEACPDFRCVDGLGCDTVNGMQVCVKPAADGQPCSSSLACTSEYCDFTTMKCSQKKAIGGDCFSSYDCKDSYCDNASKKCTALKAAGETCVGGDECASSDCGLDMKCAADIPICDGI